MLTTCKPIGIILIMAEVISPFFHVDCIEHILDIVLCECWCILTCILQQKSVSFNIKSIPLIFGICIFWGVEKLVEYSSIGSIIGGTTWYLSFYIEIKDSVNSYGIAD